MNPRERPPRVPFFCCKYFNAPPPPPLSLDGSISGHLVRLKCAIDQGGLRPLMGPSAEDLKQKPQMELTKEVSSRDPHQTRIHVVWVEWRVKRLEGTLWFRKFTFSQTEDSLSKKNYSVGRRSSTWSLLGIESQFVAKAPSFLGS